MKSRTRDGWGMWEEWGESSVYSILFGKSKERYYLEDIVVDGRLIWKWILSK
jgi:hypothetical protein